MTRIYTKSEQVFYDHITTIVKNLLINNRNYENEYFNNCTKHDLLKDTKERATFVLDAIEACKHLINL